MLPFVNNFEILPLQKWAHFCLSCQNIRNQFPSNFLFALFRYWHFIAFIPFLQSTFALTAKQKHELNLEKKSWKLVGVISICYAGHQWSNLPCFWKWEELSRGIEWDYARWLLHRELLSNLYDCLISFQCSHLCKQRIEKYKTNNSNNVVKTYLQGVGILITFYTHFFVSERIIFAFSNHHLQVFMNHLLHLNALNFVTQS